MTAEALREETVAQPAARSGLRGLLGGTLGVLLWSLVCLALLAAAVVFGYRWYDAGRTADVRGNAVTAARQEALNLTSVDGTDLEADLARVLEGATGSFRQEFEAQSKQLRTLLQQNQVRAEGRVLDAALVRFDPDTATALVVVDTFVRNKDIPDGQTRTYRMQLDLERVGDRWLTSTLQFVA